MFEGFCLGVWLETYEIKSPAVLSEQPHVSPLESHLGLSWLQVPKALLLRCTMWMGSIVCYTRSTAIWPIIQGTRSLVDKCYFVGGGHYAETGTSRPRID